MTSPLGGRSMQTPHALTSKVYKDHPLGCCATGNFSLLTSRMVTIGRLRLARRGSGQSVQRNSSAGLCQPPPLGYTYLSLLETFEKPSWPVVSLDSSNGVTSMAGHSSWTKSHWPQLALSRTSCTKGYFQQLGSMKRPHFWKFRTWRWQVGLPTALH